MSKRTISKRTIMFCFGGRRANLALQLPFIHRILSENPDVQYHLWNTAKNPDDAAWMQGADDNHSRITIFNDFADLPTGDAWNAIYRHYAQPKFKGCRFIKLDDDVVFIQTRTLDSFIGAIDANPHAVMSANVINNGACCAADRALSDQFRRLRIRLLNAHLSPEFAEMSHEYFLSNWPQLMDHYENWVPTQDWLSINFIGYDYDMARKFAALLETQAPPLIAGRHFRGRDKLGDEGMVNTLPRIILKGFMVAHLTFGPQERKRPDLFNELRKRYAEVNKEYLKR